MSDWEQELLACLQGEALRDEPMRQHTSLRIGGPADVFVSPAGAADLSTVMRITHRHGVPVTVLGSGSNVLVSDAGVRGCVVQIGKRMGTVEFSENLAYVEAGCPLPKLAKLAADRGLSGLEFGGGIPGTLGGAVVMNAGANGGQISQITDQIEVVDRTGLVWWIPADQMEFGYRTSLLHRRRDLTVSAGRFRFNPGDPETIKAQMQSFAQKRKATQPLGLPSCGSVFKNPPGNFAGRLIEQAGCKELHVGDALVSPVHANFIINTGNARAADFLSLVELIRNRVAEQTGVHLELEVKLVGFPVPVGKPGVVAEQQV